VRRIDENQLTELDHTLPVDYLPMGLAYTYMPWIMIIMIMVAAY
jgi:hypothetical protein